MNHEVWSGCEPAAALIELKKGCEVMRGPSSTVRLTCLRLSLSSNPLGLISSACLQREGDLKGLIITQATTPLQGCSLHRINPHCIFSFLRNSASLCVLRVFMCRWVYTACKPLMRKSCTFRFDSLPFYAFKSLHILGIISCLPELSEHK